MSCVSRYARFAGAVVAALALCSAGAVASSLALSRAANDPDLEWGPCPAFFPAGCQIAVLHGDPSRPNSDVFFRVPGEYDLPAHIHTSAERMVLVAGELHITYEGQPEAVLRPGMYAYGPAKAAHWGRCVGAESCVLFIAFEGPIDATEIAGAPQ
jgi:hypothetical protein